MVNLRVTRQLGEALGSVAQTRLFVTRIGVEVLKDRDYTARVTRMVGEALGSVAASRLQVTRLALEVLGYNPESNIHNLLFTRMVGEALGSTAPARLEFTRLALEVLGEKLPRLFLTRIAAEALGHFTPRLRLGRMGVEALGNYQRLKNMEPNELPDVLPNLLSHNWTATAKMDSSFETDVTISTESSAEERRQLVDRPYRTMQVHFTALTKRDLNLLTMTIQRLSLQRMTPVPVYTDYTKTTASASGMSIPCDTRFRRFFENQRVVIHDWSSRRPGNVEYAQIDTLTDTEITLVDPLSGTFPKGSRVYPIMEAEISLGSDMALPSDETLEADMLVREVTGYSAMPRTVQNYEDPDGFELYQDRPILDLQKDWTDGLRGGYSRDGQQFKSGRAQIAFVSGDRPRFWFEARFTATRANFWPLLNFFDSRLGRLRAFWVLNPSSAFEPTVLQTNLVRMKPAGDIADWQSFFKQIAIIKKDGTKYLRGVASIVEDSGLWVVTFDEAIPSTDLADVRRITSAHLVRFQEDGLSEEWLSDGLVRTSLSMIEVLDEGAQELENATLTYGGGEPQRVPDLYYWGQANRNTYSSPSNAAKVAVGAEPDVAGSGVGAWYDIREFGGPIYLEGITKPGQLVFGDPVKNSGKAAMSAAMKFRLRPVGDTFFDNVNGLTVFISALVGNSAGTWTSILKKTGVLEWSPTVCKMFATLDAEVSAANITTPNLFSDRLSSGVVLCLHWVPGVSAKIYRNGELMGSAATPAAGLAVQGTRELDVLDMASQFYADDVAIYQRGLTTDELNAVGKFFCEMHGTSWTEI